VTRRIAQQLAIVACAAVLLLVPLATVFTPTVASQSPDTFHWARTQSQFTVQTGANLSGGWNDLFRQAVNNWNKNDTVTMNAVSGSSNPQSCSPSGGRIEVCNWKYGTQEGWLGLTRLYFDSGGTHVDGATVQMNDSFFDQSGGEYNSESARLHTICHELGHAIGLDHVGTESCMNDSQYSVFNQVTPINKDFNQLAQVYEHTDSTTTVAGSQDKQKKDKDNTKKSKKNKKNAKNTKGKNNSRKGKRNQSDDDRRGRKSRTRSDDFFGPTSLPSVPSGLVGNETVTVQTLDDGRKVISYITWAQ
jgi:hypothetical protein